MPRVTDISRLAAVAAGTMLLAACASPEARLRTGLIDAGMSAPMATCMADRMVDRLSVNQLRRVGQIGKVLKQEDLRQMSLESFLQRTRLLNDPEILGVASSSAALCAVGIG